MSPIRELLSNGVQLIGGSSARAGSPESDLPAEAFAATPPHVVSRSNVPIDVSDWSAVYREAGVHPPPHGYGVDRVSEMLETKRFGSLDRDTKRKAIMVALEAAGVSIRDVIQDALMRDHALEAFERAKQREVEELRARTEGRVKTIQQELETVIRESNSELERLKRATEESGPAFAQFHERKRREEERLRGVLAHFVREEDNPIVLSEPGVTSVRP